MKRILTAILIALILTGTLTVTGFGQRLRASSVEIVERKDLSFGGQNVGKLFINVNGKRRKIADEAALAWLIDSGREIVYSGSDGAGGFENIGQSLRIYNVATQRARKVFSDYFPVKGLTEVRLTNGARVLLVRGSGGETECVPFAVVDVRRGEVFSHCAAQLLKIKGDFITLAIDPEYDEDEVSDENDTTALGSSKMKKYRKQRTYDLKKLIKRKVIFNRPTE